MCVREVTAYRCLKQRMKQSLSNVVGIRKRASREELFSFLEYELIARRTKADDDTELEAQLRSRKEAVRDMLGGMSKKGTHVLSVWRTKPIEELVYSRSTLASPVHVFREPEFDFKKRFGCGGAAAVQ